MAWSIHFNTLVLFLPQLACTHARTHVRTHALHPGGINPMHLSSHCGPRDGAQGLVHARQTLCHWTTFPVALSYALSPASGKYIAPPTPMKKKLYAV